MEGKTEEQLTFKVNDKNAPRFGKGKYIETLFTKSFLENFKEQYPEYKKKEFKEFIKDWERLVDAMIDIVLEEPDGIQMGNNMGEMKLGLLRVHNVIDKKASQKAGTPVKYLNFHTNRKPAKLVWKTEYARIVHFFLRYLGFKGTKAINKKCMHQLKTDGNKFKDVTDNHKFIK